MLRATKACQSRLDTPLVAVLAGLAFLLIAGDALAVGTWESRALSPTQRRVPGVAAVNGILYAAGGAPPGGSSSITTVEAYDPTTNTWAPRASMPVATQQPAAAAIGGILYAAGGGTCCGSLATLQAYDPATNSWSIKRTMPTPRYSPAAGVVNDKLYVVGGGSGYGAIFASLEEYDPASNTWTVKAPMPTPRANLGIGVVNGILYAVGGNDLDGPHTTVEAYDAATNTWTRRAPMPTARSSLTVGVIDGVLYAVGGTDAARPVSTVEAYDPATDTWRTMTSLPVQRGTVASGVIDRVMYVVGSVNTDFLTLHAFTPAPRAPAQLGIDFSNATGFGGGSMTAAQFQINNIALDVANPFDATQVLTSRFNVLWALDNTPSSPHYLHLIARGIVQSSGTGATTRRGSVQVTVNDALTGSPVTAATVTQSGGGSTRFVDSSGSATFTDVPAGGAIQFSASAAGYATGNGTVTPAANITTPLTVSLMPIHSTTGGTDPIRIVLNWGQSPSDLDSHLTGPATGTTRFHVAYYNRGSSTSTSLPNLDVDDVTSFGPETITIPTTALRAGTYRYSVHHYTGSTSLCASPARVAVYRGTTVLRTFAAPSTGCTGGSDGTGDIWTVFTLDGATGNITPVNTLTSAQSSSSSLFKVYAGALVESEDPAIFWNQPGK